MHASFTVLCLLLSGTPATKPAPPSVTLERCSVFLINEAQVPAEEAGVLVDLKVVEGQQVKAGELLGQVKDTDAQLAAKGAKAKFEAAREEASSTVNVRYARKAAEVAEAEYQSGVSSNKTMPGTTPLSELRRLLLTWQRSVLEIEKADSDLKVAGLKAKVSEAESEQAAEAVLRRQIRSPLDGQVVELLRHAGEWVKPGDPVVRVVQLNRLKIRGLLSAAEIEPSEVAHRAVTVVVQLARGHQESFRGEVVAVNPLVEARGKFSIRAEVDNRMQDGHWLLLPGHTVDMAIQLK